MRIVGIVLVLILGLFLHGPAMADQEATTKEKTASVEERMPPSSDAVDHRRHLVTEAERRKKRGDNGDGGATETALGDTDTVGKDTVGKALIEKAFPNKKKDDPVDNGNNGGDKRRKNFFNDNFPNAPDNQRNNQRIHQQHFDEQKKQVVQKVEGEVTAAVADKVKKRLDAMGCNRRRNLEEASESRNLRLGNLVAEEDEKAGDGDKAEKRKLQDSDGGSDGNKGEESAGDEESDGDKDRKKRLKALKTSNFITAAINKIVDDEVEKARAELDC